MQVTIVDVWLMPALFTVLGLVLYGAALAQFFNGGRVPKWRWVALPAFLAALVFGVMKTWALINPKTGEFYRLSLPPGNKVLLSHYLAPLLPILALMFMMVMELRTAPKKRRDDDDF